MIWSAAVLRRKMRSEYVCFILSVNRNRTHPSSLFETSTWFHLSLYYNCVCVWKWDRRIWKISTEKLAGRSMGFASENKIRSVWYWCCRAKRTTRNFKNKMNAIYVEPHRNDIITRNHCGASSYAVSISRVSFIQPAHIPIYRIYKPVFGARLLLLMFFEVIFNFIVHSRSCASTTFLRYLTVRRRCIYKTSFQSR